MRTRRLGIVCTTIAAFVAAAAFTTSAIVAPRVARASTTTSTDTYDEYVSSGTPNENHNTATYDAVEGSSGADTQDSLLYFTVSGLTGTFESATLSINVTDGTGAYLEADAIDPTTWIASPPDTATYNDVVGTSGDPNPEIDQYLDSVASNGLGDTTFNVSAYPYNTDSSGNGTWAIALIGDTGSTQMQFTSTRDTTLGSAFWPTLTINDGVGVDPTPTEDTYVSSGTPHEVYDTATKDFLESSSGADTQIAFEQFMVTGVPAGETIATASLQLDATQTGSSSVDIDQANCQFNQAAISYTTNGTTSVGYESACNGDPLVAYPNTGSVVLVGPQTLSLGNNTLTSSTLASSAVSLGSGSFVFDLAIVNPSGTGQAKFDSAHNTSNQPVLTITTTGSGTPTISSFAPTCVTIAQLSNGVSVTAQGANLGNATAMTFYNAKNGTITNDTEGAITGMVPNAAITGGPIKVTTAGGTATSSGNLTIAATCPGSTQPHILVVQLENTGYIGLLTSTTCTTAYSTVKQHPFLCALSGQSEGANTCWVDGGSAKTGPCPSTETSLGGNQTTGHGFFAQEHPSLPNYFDVMSGYDQGCTSDTAPPAACVPSPSTGGVSASSFTGLLNASDIPWMAAMEGMNASCSLAQQEPTSGQLKNATYARKHDPFVFFGDSMGGIGSTYGNECLAGGPTGHTLAGGYANIIPLNTPANLCTDTAECEVGNTTTGDIGACPNTCTSTLSQALEASGADFAWVSPNQYDDMHTSEPGQTNKIAMSDRWLEETIEGNGSTTGIVNSSWYKNSTSTIIITEDESRSDTQGCGTQCSDGSAGGQVPLVIISSNAAGCGTITAWDTTNACGASGTQSTGDSFGLLWSLQSAYGVTGTALGKGEGGGNTTNGANSTDGDVVSLFG